MPRRTDQLRRCHATRRLVPRLPLPMAADAIRSEDGIRPARRSRPSIRSGRLGDRRTPRERQRPPRTSFTTSTERTGPRVVGFVPSHVAPGLCSPRRSGLKSHGHGPAADDLTAGAVVSAGSAGSGTGFRGQTTTSRPVDRSFKISLASEERGSYRRGAGRSPIRAPASGQIGRG